MAPHTAIDNHRVHVGDHLANVQTTILQGVHQGHKVLLRARAGNDGRVAANALDATHVPKVVVAQVLGILPWQCHVYIRFQLCTIAKTKASYGAFGGNATAATDAVPRAKR
jgi:hypothetical protein